MSRFYLHGENKIKKNALYLSFNVFTWRKYFTGTLFFYAKFIQRNCLMKFKKENEDFLDYKNIKLKTLQNSHFSKEVSPWFLSKNWHFSNYCYLQNESKKSPWRSSKNKMKTFLDYKNIDLKQPQNFHFPKGSVHGFSPKIFQTG